MKVSIITFHDEDNYGAVLQTYATYRVIENLGHTPEIINLHMANKQGIIRRLVFALKRKRFNDFRNKHFKNITKVYNSINELRNDPPKSDCYLVGSDQTWNPNISMQDAMAYFLDFGPDEVLRLSYASSFGISEWEDNENAPTNSVKQSLSKIKKLLVREDKAVEICKKYFGLDSTQVIDPVLLFPRYDELTGCFDEQNDNMILYKLGKQQKFYDVAAKLATDLQLKRESIGSVRRLKGVKTSYPQRIEDWIKKIGSAKFVFTDSFHGTVISILYHRQFVVYGSNDQCRSRFYSLLKLVGLEDRLCLYSDKYEHLLDIARKPIDYNVVDKKLALLRESSISELSDAISTIL